MSFSNFSANSSSLTHEPKECHPCKEFCVPSVHSSFQTLNNRYQESAKFPKMTWKALLFAHGVSVQLRVSFPWETYSILPHLLFIVQLELLIVSRVYIPTRSLHILTSSDFLLRKKLFTVKMFFWSWLLTTSNIWIMWTNVAKAWFKKLKSS